MILRPDETGVTTLPATLQAASTIVFDMLRKPENADIRRKVLDYDLPSWGAFNQLLTEEQWNRYVGVQADTKVIDPGQWSSVMSCVRFRFIRQN